MIISLTFLYREIFLHTVPQNLFIVISSTSTTTSVFGIESNKAINNRRSSIFVIILSDNSIKLFKKTTLFLKYDISTPIKASLTSLIFGGVSDFLTERVVGSGNSISGTYIFVFSEAGFKIILLLILFVFEELVDSLLYFNSNVI
jgi:hypothetical protein